MIELVTGGAGFIGSNLCDLLLSYGVICEEDLITPNTRNINSIKNKKIKYIRHDITNPIYSGEKIDFIFLPGSLIDYGITNPDTAKRNHKVLRSIFRDGK